MGIKIKVSDHVRFKVAGSINSEAGAAEDFDFSFVARRLKQDALSEALSKRTAVELLTDVVTDWHGVLDDDAVPVPFSEPALAQLLGIVGLAPLAVRCYIQESGAKEKN